MTDDTTPDQPPAPDAADHVSTFMSLPVEVQGALLRILRRGVFGTRPEPGDDSKIPDVVAMAPSQLLDHLKSLNPGEIYAAIGSALAGRAMDVPGRAFAGLRILQAKKQLEREQENQPAGQPAPDHSAAIAFLAARPPSAGPLARLSAPTGPHARSTLRLTPAGVGESLCGLGTLGRQCDAGRRCCDSLGDGRVRVATQTAERAHGVGEHGRASRGAGGRVGGQAYRRHGERIGAHHGGALGAQGGDGLDSRALRIGQPRQAAERPCACGFVPRDRRVGRLAQRLDIPPDRRPPRAGGRRGVARVG